MNKLKKIFSSLKPHLTAKNLKIVLILFFLVVGIFYWFGRKTRESIKEHRFLVATDSRWSQLDLRGQERYMQGFISELLDAIGNEENIHLRLVPVASSELLDQLDKGYYDGVVTSLSSDILSGDKYIFSDPFYLTGPVLIVPVHSKAKSISDLDTIGVKTGFFTAFSIVGEPLVSIIYYENMNEALSQLLSGKIDGLIMNSLDAYAYIQGYYAGKLKVATPPLNKSGLRLASLHTFFGKHLVEIFDEGVQKLKEEKIYDQLLNKWELVNPETAYTK
ncbi:MAG TPA: transporter substrate-binding domain-containing protein [Parachlamydiaceae bacterium]|nr:transporter substrate-binding domain-containing protein [Parachlamydiaceae bacterium]